VRSLRVVAVIADVGFMGDVAVDVVLVTGAVVIGNPFYITCGVGLG
jgi:hypothetical protein